MADTITLKDVGNIIKKVRKDNGWTQGQLAKKAGLYDASSVSKIELGQSDMALTTLQKIADALKVSPGVLLGDIPYSPYFPIELDKQKEPEVDDTIDKLTKLVDYYKEGLISKEEYLRTKERLLK